MRIRCFDVLKAVAIIAVVLYHMGICKFGYLGVDIFLVIAGYFTSKSVEKHIINRGGYLSFILNRAFRLWPLLLLIGIVCLTFGWFMMLPDDFENTAQSVVATNFFGNNILESITTKNYWDVGNDYKPLMHTWYVGLLMQYYVIVPLLLFIAGNYISEANKRRKVNIILTSLLGLLSLFLYIISDDASAKFYYLPYRLYEFCAGALVYYLFAHKNIDIKKSVVKIAISIIYLCVIALLFIELDFISRPIKLIAVVGLTALLIDLMSRVNIEQNNIFQTNK